MCNNSFIIHLHRISDEEGKLRNEGKKERKRQTRLDLNSAPLGCEE